MTMVLLLRDNRDDRGWICRVVARFALFVNFLDFAGLAMYCRNAAIR